MRQSYRCLATWLAIAAAVPLISVCTDSAVSPGSRAKSAGLSIAPVFSASAGNALQAYHASGMDIDRVRITIARPPSDTLSDQEVLLAGRGQQFALDFTVSAFVGEMLTARVEFRSGITPLFAGSRSVVARALDDTSTPADQIDVLPIGPGATAARVTVTPASGSFPTTAPVTFTARAFDQANNELAGALFNWSVDNAAVASVNATGVVQPTAVGGALRVRATTLNSVTGEASVTFAALPGHLALATQPSGATSGVSFATQPVVQIRDASNNLVSTSSAAVTAAIASGSGTLTGTRTVNAVNGVATFTDLRIDGGGPHTLTFTATGLAAVVSSTFTVTQSITALVVQTQPGGATSGRPFTTQPVVQIADNTGIIVAGSALPVTARVTSGTGTLTGTTTITASNGAATFSDLRIDGSGPHTLSFSTATPALQVASASFTVGAAAPTQLAITQQPAGAVSGVALANQPVIQIRDASNNLVASSNLLITASIGTGTGTLAGTTTVSAVNGVATFTNLGINGSGVHTLSFSAAGLTGATSAAFTVTQTPASLSIQTQPGGATSGSPLSIQPLIRVLDNAGLPVGNAIAVTAAITSGTGTLVGTTSVTTVSGVATFTNLRIDGSGPHILTFFTTNPTLQVASAPFAVGSAGATQLVITTQPAGAVSGVNFVTQPVVEARDANNVLVSGSAVAVTATIASGTGTLVGTTTVIAVNGVATFTNLRINGAGVHALNFSASGLAAGRSGSLTVTQTAAALAIQTQPGGAVSGSPLSIQPVIRVLDNAGILIAASTVPVTAAVTSGDGSLLGTTTVSAVGGVATFTNLRVDGTGVQVLTFSTAAPALQIASAAFAVGTAAPTQLVITRQPSGAVSGVDLTTQPVVEVRDANNNLVTGTLITVTVSIATGTGTLVGTTSAGTVNGVATFTNLRISGSGPHTLTFTAGTLTPATSASFTVTQNSVALDIQTQPGGSVSGSPLTIQPVIRILDNAGLPVANSTLAVTAAITGGTGAGTVSAGATVNAIAGVARFTGLTITGSGQVALTFSSATPALQTAAAPLSVLPAASPHLLVATQPAGAVSGVNFSTQPVVEVRDANNALVAAFTGSVTAAIGSGTGTIPVGTLVTANFINGVATFIGLRINGSGQHTLAFSAPNATSAASATFTVTQIPASLEIQAQPGGGTSGSPLPVQPVVRVLDNASLVVSGYTSAVTATITPGSGSGAVASGGTVNAANGIATFTSLQVDGTGPQTLTFSTSNPPLSIVSTAFAMNAAPATQVIIRTQPGGGVSGVDLTIQPVIEFRDANNAIVAGSTGSVLAQIASGTGNLVGNTTANAVNGVATFTNLRINGAGPQTISFTAIGLPIVASASFVVTQTAAALAIQTQPGPGSTGTPLSIQPAIRILDNAGILIANSSLPVTAIINSATAAGSITAGATVNAVGGIATFTNLTVTGSGGFTLVFSTPSPTLQTVPSAPFAVNAPNPQTLTVLGSGTGSGNVTSNPTGISCVITNGNASATGCNASFPFGTPVTLTAAPKAGNFVDGGNTFATWSAGGCSTGTACVVTMDQARSATATFTAVRFLNLSGAGSGIGRITSTPAGIDCTITVGNSSGICFGTFSPGAPVTLSATPSSGSLLTGWWTGSCGIANCQALLCASSTTCTVRLDSSLSYQAAFGTGYPNSFSKIASGWEHTCGLAGDQLLRCWGFGVNGVLGNQNYGTQFKPDIVPGTVNFTGIASGFFTVCGIAANNDAYCWGSNQTGQVGDGTSTFRATPILVKGGIKFKTISPGDVFTCGIATNDSVYCWGDNVAGELGDGTFVAHQTPAQVAGGQVFATISAGFRSACATTLTGDAYCWGANVYGGVGDGTTVNRPVPTLVKGNLKFSSVSSGYGYSTCGVTTGQALYCWGQQRLGFDPYPTLTPTLFASGFTSVSLGGSFACAISTSADAYCWGSGGSGQLGNGSTSQFFQDLPTRVVGGLKFSALQTGGSGTCGMTPGQVVYCWGLNPGDGSVSQSVPTRVTQQP